ncbi:hypothetical protein Ddc_24803 [Ditylenchus destructor]|nr:hypothetical protein Ddc_24803 [Ditylenchus destructor]
MRLLIANIAGSTNLFNNDEFGSSIPPILRPPRPPNNHEHRRHHRRPRGSRGRRRAPRHPEHRGGRAAAEGGRGARAADAAEDLVASRGHDPRQGASLPRELLQAGPDDAGPGDRLLRVGAAGDGDGPDRHAADRSDPAGDGAAGGSGAGDRPHGGDRGVGLAGRDHRAHGRLAGGGARDDAARDGGVAVGHRVGAAVRGLPAGGGDQGHAGRRAPAWSAGPGARGQARQAADGAGVDGVFTHAGGDPRPRAAPLGRRHRRGRQRIRRAGLRRRRADGAGADGDRAVGRLRRGLDGAVAKALSAAAAALMKELGGVVPGHQRKHVRVAHLAVDPQAVAQHALVERADSERDRPTRLVAHRHEDLHPLDLQRAEA